MTVNSEELVALGEKFIEHHGIKGMKWGVRKEDASSSSVRSSSTSSSLKSAVPTHHSLSEAQKTNLKRIGKTAVTAALIGGGSIAVASVAGPHAGALAATMASAIARSFSTTSSTTDSSFSARNSVSPVPGHPNEWKIFTPSGQSAKFVGSSVGAGKAFANQWLSAH